MEGGRCKGRPDSRVFLVHIKEVVPQLKVFKKEANIIKLAYLEVSLRVWCVMSGLEKTGFS